MSVVGETPPRPATPPLNLALEVPCTEAEGPGRRYAIWVQGCPLRCPGCCNPEMLPDVAAHHRAVDDVVADLRLATKTHHLSGLSLLGGEPTTQAAGLAVVAEAAQALGLNVMIYSGFTRAALEARDDDHLHRLLRATDLLVDGPYIEAQQSQRRRFIGSENQGLHALTLRGTAALLANPVEAHHTDGTEDVGNSTHNTVELRLRLDGDGAIYTINGWPVRGSETR